MVCNQRCATCPSVVCHFGEPASSEKQKRPPAELSGFSWGVSGHLSRGKQVYSSCHFLKDRNKNDFSSQKVAPLPAPDCCIYPPPISLQTLSIWFPINLLVSTLLCSWTWVKSSMWCSFCAPPPWRHQDRKSITSLPLDWILWSSVYRASHHRASLGHLTPPPVTLWTKWVYLLQFTLTSLRRLCKKKTSHSLRGAL